MKYLVITLLTVFMAFASLACDEPATETDQAVVVEDSVEVVEEVVTTETITEETVTTETVTEEIVTTETPVEEVVEGEEVDEAVEGEQPVTQ
ncbi:MAG: hypothetical protein R6V62_09405 [Candidatus Fermentibacteraceae bacterium]